MRLFTPFLFAFVLICLHVQASGLAERQFKVDPKKVTITEDGIFAYVEGNDKPVMGRSLSFDEHGNLLLKDVVLSRGPCYIHDLWCHRCGGCGVLLCPMNCSCFD